MKTFAILYNGIKNPNDEYPECIDGILWDIIQGKDFEDAKEKSEIDYGYDLDLRFEIQSIYGYELASKEELF